MKNMEIKSALPKYYWIKNYIMDRINDNRLKPDDMLPSEKELMELFSVSRITVRKALDDLVMEGHVYKIQGKGTYVKQLKPSNIKFSRKLISCSDEIRSQNMIPSRKVLHQQLITADPETAKTFDLVSDSQILWYERIYFANRIPMNYANSYINLQYVPGLEKFDLENNSMLSIIADFYKYEVERKSRIIEAVAAHGHLVEELGVPEGFPLLQVKSISNCIVQGSSTPFEINTSCYRTDIIRFTVEEP